MLLASSVQIAGHALASAWNRAPGEGIVILDEGADWGDAAFDRRGRIEPARRYDKSEVGLYGEYGATDRLMLLARPSLDRIAVGAPDGGRYGGLGGTSLGAQWQALAFDGTVLALQGSLGVPGSSARANPALVGNTSRYAEVRLLAGEGLPGPLRPFLEAQAAFRLRSGGDAAEWRLDVTAGFRPADDILLFAQAFTVASDRAARARWATRLDLKAVYALTPAWAIQVGAFQAVAGRDSLRERGLTAGIWYTF